MRATALALVGIVLLGWISAPTMAGERDLEKHLKQIREAVDSLRVLGYGEEAARLHKVARRIMEKLEAGHKERQAAEHQIEVMRLAMKALLEEENHDLAHRLEQKIHAIELALKGRRDAEAREIMEGAPKRGEVAEILRHAAHIWEEFGHESKADYCRTLAEQYAHQAEPSGRREGENRERAIAKRHLEILRLSLPALREGEKGDAVELVERAIRATEVSLEGRRDREADAIRKRAPGKGDLAKCLLMAAELWHHFGNQDKSQACAELGRHLKKIASEQGKRERPHRGEGDRITNLEKQVKNLTNLVEELYKELKRLQGDRR